MKKTGKIVHEIRTLSEPLFEAHLFDEDDECKRILAMIHELTADTWTELPPKFVRWGDDGKPYLCEANV